MFTVWLQLKSIANIVLDTINAVYYHKPLIFNWAIHLRFIKAVSDNVLDKINAAYYVKPLILTRAIYLRFIKAVSDTVLDKINAVYSDSPDKYQRLVIIKKHLSCLIQCQKQP